MSRERLIALVACSVVACSGAVRATFQASDSTFRPAPGPRPRIYLDESLGEVPRTGIRSVGLISVRVPRSSGMKRVVELAADKGQELGCWIVVEHEAFASRPRADLDDGVSIILAHGPGPHVGAAPQPEMLAVQFDCIVRSTGQTARQLPVTARVPL